MTLPAAIAATQAATVEDLFGVFQHRWLADTPDQGGVEQQAAVLSLQQDSTESLQEDEEVTKFLSKFLSHNPIGASENFRTDGRKIFRRTDGQKIFRPTGVAASAARPSI